MSRKWREEVEDECREQRLSAVKCERLECQVQENPERSQQKGGDGAESKAKRDGEPSGGLVVTNNERETLQRRGNST